jgi:hypothetical protein
MQAVPSPNVVGPNMTWSALIMGATRVICQSIMRRLVPVRSSNPGTNAAADRNDRQALGGEVSIGTAH